IAWRSRSTLRSSASRSTSAAGSRSSANTRAKSAHSTRALSSGAPGVVEPVEERLLRGLDRPGARDRLERVADQRLRAGAHDLLRVRADVVVGPQLLRGARDEVPELLDGA